MRKEKGTVERREKAALFGRGEKRWLGRKDLFATLGKTGKKRRLRGGKGYFIGSRMRKKEKLKG